MTPSREIYTRVASVLAESLGVDEDDVIPSATLQGDLGAESIDFLDIVFRLEREKGNLGAIWDIQVISLVSQARGRPRRRRLYSSPRARAVSRAHPDVP
jgi:acyl carrier protein